MDAHGDTPTTREPLAQQSAELAALRRMLAASEGTFSFSVAICNSSAVRDYLISKLREESPSIAIVEVNKEVADILDFVRTSIVGTNSAGIFVVGIEKLLPSDRKEHKVLRVLNVTREAWQSHFTCPVVFWLPEYAATLLSIHARDLWSWVSHTFEFVSEQATAMAGRLDAYAGDITSAGRLDADQKRFRIAELEQRIADVGDPPRAQLTQHVLTWLNELAYILFAVGNLNKAEETIRKSLEIEEKLGRLEGVATAYGNLGLIYRTRGDLDKAEQMHSKALKIEERLGRLEGTAMHYGNLGVIYLTRGELDKAEQLFRKSLGINEKLGRLEGIAAQCGNLGLIYRTRGDLNGAAQMVAKSLEINEKLGRSEGVARDCANLSAIYLTRGDMDKAEQMVGKAMEIDEKLGRLEGMASDYGNLGSVYKKRGDIEKAREYWKKALELFKKIGMRPEIEKTQRLIDELKNK